MLAELQIKDFAIIDNLQMSVSPGLNIISGETGAGKSVLVKSLGLLMGVKTDSDDVRSGASEAIVQGAFDISHREDVKNRLNKLSISHDEDELIVRRVISNQGKNKVYLNGQMCTLNDLREIVSPMIELAENDAPLIEMTGQHDTKHLLSKSYHIDLVDHYAGLMVDRKNYVTSFHEIQKIKSLIETKKNNFLNQLQQLDYFKFQLKQIEDLKLSPGEEEDLTQKIKLAKNSEKIQSALKMTEEGIENALSSLNVVKKELAKFIDYKSLGDHLDSVNQVIAQLDEISYSISKEDVAGDTDFDLDSAEKKLSDLRKLQKIFGPNIEAILTAKEKLKTDISNIENHENEISQLQKDLAKAELQAKSLAETLHEKRISSARHLEKLVNKELLDLNMKGLSFFINIEKLTELSSMGLSDVEFLTQTSKNDAKKPLLKYASGGELSRILLSLKSVTQQSPNPRTYLFDEVDTGISGETAEKVGKKLKKISQGQQVLCVTHLPQVACQGDAHYLIQKSTIKNRAELKIEKLNKNSRIEELARLISGEKISKTSIEHAKELLNEASTLKL